MGQIRSRRAGRREYNGLEVNLYGFLPEHLIRKDQEAAPEGFADHWDPGNTRLESLGDPGDTKYSKILQDRPRRKTIAVFSGMQALADDGEGALRDGSGAKRGTVNYRTSRLQVEFASPAEYEVFVTYATGLEAPYASTWDEPDAVWDRISRQPVLQRTFWAIELDATNLSNQVEQYRDLAYVDEISSELAPYAFEGYGFDGQIVDLDIELSRTWLRSMRTQWQLKSSLRMWRRLLQNLGFDAAVYPLYKKHPLDNYGENPGEIYSRVYTEITLEQQRLYERALEAAGYDPAVVPSPVTGSSVTHRVGVGNGSSQIPIQVPVITDPPIWSTAVLKLYSVTGGLDPETFTINSATGEISGSSGATGSVNLLTGTGQIDFGRLLSVEFYVEVTYTVIGTPYQAARVDVELSIDENVSYRAGDRAPSAVRRVLDFVRPIHVLIRLMVLKLLQEEQAVISEGSCCGPNQAEIVSYEFPVADSVEAPTQPAGGVLYGGTLTNAPVRRNTFSIVDPVSGQLIRDNGLGEMVGDGAGAISYQYGLWWVQFGSPTLAIPEVNYSYYSVSPGAAQAERIRYLADAFDMGEARQDRDFSEILVSYIDQDIESDYHAMLPDLVGGARYAGTLNADLIPGEVVIHDYATGQVVTDDGAGNLVGDVDGAGFNTVDYVTGSYDVTFQSSATDPVAVFQYNDLGAHLPDQEDLFIGFQDAAIIEGDTLFILRSSVETEAIGLAGTDTYSGTLSQPVTPGSAQFFEDPGPGQSLADIPVSPLSGLAGSGTINYSTGALTLSFNAPTQSSPVVRYQYVKPDGFEANGELTLTPAGELLYSATLAGGQIIPGSVIVTDTVAGESMQDTGEVSLTGDGTGTLNYLTRAYSLSFSAVTSDPVAVQYSSRSAEVV